MSLKEIVSQLGLRIVNLYLKSCTFYLHFILYLHLWIRIHRAPEYVSNVDLDPDPN